MKFRTDRGGVSLCLPDVKLMTTETASTWNTRLSQIGRVSGRVIIVTYSLPDLEYMSKIFDKRSSDVTIIYNSRFSQRGKALQRKYPGLRLIARPDVHAKIVMIEPETVWLSSANFGRSGWFEHTIGIHSRDAYTFYMTEILKYLGREEKGAGHT